MKEGSALCISALVVCSLIIGLCWINIGIDSMLPREKTQDKCFWTENELAYNATGHPIMHERYVGFGEGIIITSILISALLACIIIYSGFRLFEFLAFGG